MSFFTDNYNIITIRNGEIYLIFTLLTKSIFIYMLFIYNILHAKLMRLMQFCLLQPTISTKNEMYFIQYQF
jgi:hypothetical protein